MKDYLVLFSYATERSNGHGFGKYSIFFEKRFMLSPNLLLFGILVNNLGSTLVAEDTLAHFIVFCNLNYFNLLPPLSEFHGRVRQ